MQGYPKCLAVTIILAAIANSAQAADETWSKVGEALGKAGAEMPGSVYRVGLPRTDLKVTLDGIEIKPGFALGSWVAFQKMGSESMVMGDLVLTADEVSPVMAKLIAGGIEVTALHNHLLRNQPFTMYMHVFGRGDPVKLATTLHRSPRCRDRGAAAPQVRWRQRRTASCVRPAPCAAPRRASPGRHGRARAYTS